MTRVGDNAEFNDLVTLVSIHDVGAPISNRMPKWRRIVARTRPYLLFFLMVIVPTTMGCLYYGLIASDLYASETKFIVRSPNRNAAGLLSGFLQSTGFVRAQDDSYIVSEFILSRAAMNELVKANELKEILSRPEADFLTRFPLPWVTPSDEQVFEHYLRFVEISTDSGSGVTALQIRATRPDDAWKLADALLQHSEKLINRLNDRARQDAIRYAQVEVWHSERRLSHMQKRLTDFRNREVMVDPTKQSAAALDLIARLSDEVSESKTRLMEVEVQTPQSPQVEALRVRITATERQISEERARIVGSDNSMAPRIAQYEQLLLEREMATKMLASATASLESAKIDAQRQQLYLERIANPNLPDYALYPKRLRSVLLLFAIFFSIYWIASFFTGQLLEHAESQ
ncbi:capsule biosynthesis protein [Mesorhizobium sp. NPDC059025]|uniref:capsule biosynthesis protein n=1 Tax=unclassified Mesorhizobium TaxID=325217 RepID=UPI003671089C